MSRHTPLYTWGAILSIAFVAFGALVFTQQQKPSTSVDTVPTAVTETVSISIDTLYEQETITINQGDTVLDVLETLDADDPRIGLVTTEYPGLGTLVVEMGGKTNGDSGAYWQYEVNGIMPPRSADTLALTAGDAVTWYFRESSW